MVYRPQGLNADFIYSFSSILKLKKSNVVLYLIYSVRPIKFILRFNFVFYFGLYSNLSFIIVICKLLKSHMKAKRGQQLIHLRLVSWVFQRVSLFQRRSESCFLLNTIHSMINVVNNFTGFHTIVGRVDSRILNYSKAEVRIRRPCYIIRKTKN